MDVPEDGLLLKIIDGLFALLLSGLGWLINAAHQKTDDQAQDVKALRQEHNNFKVEVSKDYARTHVVEAMADRIDDKLEDINRDIKELLSRGR